ncbi:MAG: O-antigen ligase family protein [Candidatus Yanofskybacteria bacterium]|nr:O-antigen ligase family protein [Candidatus Yanofskybacteria bacterium]
MKNNFLNWFFVVEIILFGLIITGILPRETALYLGAALVIYFLAARIDDSLVFFVRSIPLFLAMPLTASFDNFNIWRILVVIIFLKWAWPQVKNKIKTLKNISYFSHDREINTIVILLLILLLFAILSIIPAPDKIAAIKRIIFFLNFAIFGIVLYYKAADPVKSDDHGAGKEFVKRLIKNSMIPVIIVATVGYIQVISTYFIDIYQFMRIWGEGIQCRQFGEQWCNIAVQLGNTWFAYYGEQLSLRVFSLFPDSHSFPQFVLLGIPAIFAISPLLITNRPKLRIKRMGFITLLSLLFLIAILSGTRGIWAASVGVVLLYFGLMLYMRKWELTKLSYDNFVSFKKLGWCLVIFFAMFAVAFPIFSSPQFLIGKSDDILKQRLKSIIDFGETSNAQRIEIWKKTLISIKEKPFLGVGIGNYPVVLKQDIRLAKAGSSAHNLYLHVAAEMGILAGIIFIWFLWLLFKRNYEIFINLAKIKSDLYYDVKSRGDHVALRDRGKNTTDFLRIYFAATLLFVPWVLIYSLTDIAIFDERALLFALIPISIILGIKKAN